MKTLLLTLLLLCLCVPVHCDCQGDCLTCSQLLPKELNFNILVCLVECEGNVSPAFTWDLCRKASAPLRLPSLSVGGAVLKRAQEEVEALMTPDDEAQGDAGLLRFDHVARALGMDTLDRESRTNLLTGGAYGSQQPQQLSAEEGEEEEEEEEGGEGEGEREQQQDVAGLSLQKRFGGFLKGKHGYRKLMGSGRSLQKRYGGFIGVRKSARKWNNQKRFSEFLKQYMGMSTRATEYNSVSADITRQNEV